MLYDCVIIGGGPAGMTAAIYAARKKIRTLLLTKTFGGQMVWSADVENYPGFTMISGADLEQHFEDHLRKVPGELELMTGETVTHIERGLTSFAIYTDSHKQFYARTVLITSGREPKHLGVPGEKEFYGHGVAVCATCDAPLYKGKDVAVVGGGNSAMDAVLALSKVARQVHVIFPGSALTGEAVMRTKISTLVNVQQHPQTEVQAILGDKQVQSIRIWSKKGGQQDISIDGVFVEIGYTPSSLFDDLTAKNDKGEIVVDQNFMTDVPGVFAAGDVNDSWGGQIIIAAGEGAKAALAIARFLNLN